MNGIGLESEKMGSDRLDGAAAPWGAYRDAHSTYELSLFGQVGSGLLGGWSYMCSGGYFDPASRQHAEAEAWEEYRLRRRRPPWAEPKGGMIESIARPVGA